MPGHLGRVWIGGVAVAALQMLVGCSSAPPAPVQDRGTSARAAPAPAPGTPPGYYVVKKGDTLYSIALNHGQDHKDVAAWNKLDDPNKLEVGQQLRVAPPEGSAVAVARPIAGPAAVEVRPLGAPGAPSSSAGVGAASVTGNESFKREPKGGKSPYSEQALAQMQKSDEAARKPQDVVLAAPSAPRPEPRPEVIPEAKPEPKPEAKPAEVPAAGESSIAWSWPAAGKVIAPFNDSTSKGVDIGGKLGDPVVASADGKVVYAGSGLRGYGKLVIIKHDNTYLSAYAHNNQILVQEGQAVSKGQKIAELGNTDSDLAKLHFEIRRHGKPVDPLKYLPSR
jgi:lipoprotein NlpD